MANRTDARGMLDEEPFSYQESRDGKVFLYWHGRQVVLLKEEAAKRFLSRMAGKEGKEAQLIMAKATGNFKRGNEKGR